MTTLTLREYKNISPSPFTEFVGTDASVFPDSIKDRLIETRTAIVDVDHISIALADGECLGEIFYDGDCAIRVEGILFDKVLGRYAEVLRKLYDMEGTPFHILKKGFETPHNIVLTIEGNVPEKIHYNVYEVGKWSSYVAHCVVAVNNCKIPKLQAVTAIVSNAEINKFHVSGTDITIAVTPPQMIGDWFVYKFGNIDDVHTLNARGEITMDSDTTADMFAIVSNCYIRAPKTGETFARYAW